MSAPEPNGKTETQNPVGSSELVRRCACDKPEYALCTPVAMTDEGIRLLEANRIFIRKYVCFSCGGVAESKPESYAHITGESVIRRLLELGIAKPPNVPDDLPPPSNP